MLLVLTRVFLNICTSCSSGAMHCRFTNTTFRGNLHSSFLLWKFAIVFVFSVLGQFANKILYTYVLLFWGRYPLDISAGLFQIWNILYDLCFWNLLPSTASLVLSQVFISVISISCNADCDFETSLGACYCCLVFIFCTCSTYFF